MAKIKVKAVKAFHCIDRSGSADVSIGISKREILKGHDTFDVDDSPQIQIILKAGLLQVVGVEKLDLPKPPAMENKSFSPYPAKKAGRPMKEKR